MSDSERQVEVPWLLSRLGNPKRILDIGSADGRHLDDLSATGAEVWLCDTRAHHTPPGSRAFTGSAAELPREWKAYFDLVTCVSVLDHVELEAYGNEAQPGLLSRIIAEMVRVTAPGGRLLLTVPVGRNHVTTHPGGEQRVFSMVALRKLFPAKVWEWYGATFWKLDGDTYVPAEEADVKDAEYAEWRADACVALELVKWPTPPSQT